MILENYLFNDFELIARQIFKRLSDQFDSAWCVYDFGPVYLTEPFHFVLNTPSEFAYLLLIDDEHLINLTTIVGFIGFLLFRVFLGCELSFQDSLTSCYFVDSRLKCFTFLDYLLIQASLLNCDDVILQHFVDPRAI